MIISKRNRYRNYYEIVYILLVLSSKFGVHLTLTVNSDIKFSRNVFNLYLHFKKFIVEKVDSYTQTV